MPVRGRFQWFKVSIKSFVSGHALYRVDNAYFDVGNDAYLVLNDGQEYSVLVDSATPVESFCVFFPAGLADEVRHSLVTPSDGLLDDPEAHRGEPLRFVERTYPHDDLISPVLARLRAGSATGGLLEETLHDLMVRLLYVEYGTRCEAENVLALRAATRQELYRRLHIAREYTADQMMDRHSAFVTAVKDGDLAGLEALLREDPGLLDSVTPEGVPPVVLAKYYGQAAAADFLLDRGPKLDPFAAAVVGDTAVIRKAIDDDPAIVRAYSPDGWTPLHLAAFFGYPGIARLLLDAGAPVAAVSRNDQGNMPLHAALPRADLTIVTMLLDAGADVNTRQAHGFTPLHESVLIGNVALTQLLLERGADPEVRTGNGETTFDLARKQGNEEIVVILPDGSSM